MRDDFCVFILTHGRPTNVRTFNTLLNLSGYTGKLYLVIDDEDAQGEQYRRLFGERVLTFSKAAIDPLHDTYDNFDERRAILWARNACWDLARQVGCRYFVQLDDDYTNFSYRRTEEGYEQTAWTVRKIDRVFEAMIEFMEDTPTLTLAMSQGGDHFGKETDIKMKRKAMNSFVCDTERPFTFSGRVNEDVNTYVGRGRTGDLFFTYWPVQLNQKQTQTQTGGMTELYTDSGTYVKSFYTVMSNPSCVLIRPMGMTDMRLHHSIRWPHAVPRIVPESVRKTS